MSNPINFPITIYWTDKDVIRQRTFCKNESHFATFTLNGTELKIERTGIFGDYGNEPDYYCTDLEIVKAKLIEKLRKEFIVKMMELGEKIKSVESYKCKNK